MTPSLLETFEEKFKSTEQNPRPPAVSRSQLEFTWSNNGKVQKTPALLSMPDHTMAEAPLVILIHGWKGTIYDMALPQVHPGYNFEHIPFDTVRHVGGWQQYPGIGPAYVGADDLVPVQGWEPFLNSNGYPTINYQQSEPTRQDRVKRYAAQLRGLLDSLAYPPERSDVYDLRSREIVLLAHSRGGLVARAALTDLASQGSSLMCRIRRCITLHTPNQGSSFGDPSVSARMKTSLEDLIDELAKNVREELQRKLANIPPAQLDTFVSSLLSPVRAYAQEWIADAAQPGLADLAPESQAIRDLDRREKTLRDKKALGVSTFSFGGTRPEICNLRVWDYTEDSALPQFIWDWQRGLMTRFYHKLHYHVLMPVNVGALLASILRANGLGHPDAFRIPEFSSGGDSFVTAQRARHPFAESHRDNDLNHAEALWDPNLKNQVLDVLRSAPPLPPQPIAPGTSPGSSVWSVEERADWISGSPGSSITRARAGQHPDFDRLVFDVSALPGLRVRYVKEVYGTDQKPLPLGDGPKLEVILVASGPKAKEWVPGYAPVSISGYRTLSALQFGGETELRSQAHADNVKTLNVSIFGIALRTGIRQPFRVFTLKDSPRVVIDVGHEHE